MADNGEGSAAALLRSKPGAEGLGTFPSERNVNKAELLCRFHPPLAPATLQSTPLSVLQAQVAPNLHGDGQTELGQTLAVLMWPTEAHCDWMKKFSPLALPARRLVLFNGPLSMCRNKE